MSDLQNYYDAFRTGYWATEDVKQCACRGRGWALSDVDTWHQCPIHYKGQVYPEYDDGSDTRTDEERYAEEKAAREARFAPRNDLEDSDVPF